MATPPFVVANVSDNKGRGLIATRIINVGEVLETAAVIVVPAKAMAGTPLRHYAFWWDDDHHAIAFGALSMANHSDEPNTQLSRDRESSLMHLVATRRIQAGEEITHQYRETYWFSVSD